MKTGAVPAWLSSSAVVLVSIVLTLAAWEAGLRALGRTDVDGNVTVLRVRLRPYHVPLKRIGQTLERLASERSTLAYDADLGWVTQDPESGHPLYAYDSAGIRTRTADEEYAAVPESGTLRIALFGDSFAHGSDVPFEDSLGVRLEGNLRDEGVDAEVLNFGVPGYGMDQALLRLRRQGSRFSPDLVLFGFQAENLQRNVNIIRPLFFVGTGIPYSKPRFVLRDGRELEVVNQPAITGEAYMQVLENLSSWDLARYEAFYDPDDYASNPWLSSRVIALLEALARRRGRRITDDAYAIDSDPGRLGLAIVDAFSDEAASIGADFVILHMPTMRDLEDLAEGGELLYSDILATLKERHRVIDPSEVLLRAAEDGGVQALFTRPNGGHYDALASRLVAELTAASLSR